MTIAILGVGLMLGSALLMAGIMAGNAITEVSAAVESAASAIEDAAAEISPPRPTRTIAAEPGTQLACIRKVKDSLEIGYAPVLAFVESFGTSWQPLATVDGQPYLGDGLVERVLLPGQSLTNEECAEMKQRYAEAVPVEVGGLAEQSGSIGRT